MTQEDWTDLARSYNRTKDTKKKTVSCASCGKTISMSGENCTSFGIYTCLKCRIRQS